MKKIIYTICGITALSCCVTGCTERQYSAKECNAALEESDKWMQGKGEILLMELMTDIAKNKITEEEGSKILEKEEKKQHFSKVLASCEKSLKNGLLEIREDRWGIQKKYIDTNKKGA